MANFCYQISQSLILTFNFHKKVQLLEMSDLCDKCNLQGENWNDCCGCGSDYDSIACGNEHTDDRGSTHICFGRYALLEVQCPTDGCENVSLLVCDSCADGSIRCETCNELFVVKKCSECRHLRAFHESSKHFICSGHK